MLIVEVFGRFAARLDSGMSLLPEGCDADEAPLDLAALASLSGRLDDCKTEADLDEAVRYGMDLIRMGVVTPESLHEEVVAVHELVNEVGARLDAQAKMN